MEAQFAPEPRIKEKAQKSSEVKKITEYQRRSGKLPIKAGILLSFRDHRWRGDAVTPDTTRTLPDATPSTADAESYIVEPGFVSRTLWVMRRAFIAAYEDNCFSIAKGAAYSFLLSLFPILSTLTSLLIRANAQSVVGVIATFVKDVVPPGADAIVASRLDAIMASRVVQRGATTYSLSVVSVVLALWAGSGAMISLLEGFQAAYRIPAGRPFLKQRAMATFLVLIAALPAVGASSLILFGDKSEKAFIHWIGIADISAPVELAWRLARYVVAFCTTTFVTGLLYYFGPKHRPEPKQAKNLPPRFMRVWPGAFVSTSLWLIATMGFALYVRRLAHYNIFYGSVGTVIILLIWLYLIACIALIGCEFNAERERIDSMSVLQ